MSYVLQICNILYEMDDGHSQMNTYHTKCRVSYQMEGVRFEFTMSTPESELAIWDVDTMENHVQYVVE